MIWILNARHIPAPQRNVARKPASLPLLVETAQCCEQHPTCPTCEAHEIPKRDMNYRCQATTCGDDECCKPTCKSVLNNGQCPAHHTPKVDDLASEPCVGCTHTTAVEQCCEQHPKCPACGAHEIAKRSMNYRCQATTCGDDECCKPTCKSVLNN